MAGRFSRARFALFYPVYLLVLMAAANYAFYMYYRHRIDLPPPQPDRLPAVEGVTQRTMNNLGWMKTDRSNHFSRFPREKDEGVLRIGCFGNSFVYGDEVADGYDYPAFLEKVFKEHGVDTVEILNFGSSWYGFHQSFLLWSETAERYGLNLVLFGPAGFQYDRSTTFNHSGNHAHLLHARYVLEGTAGVRLVEVIGDESYSRRAEEYLRFLPHRAYLRYDRRSPAFLAAVLPPGRELNPFYYTRFDPPEEAAELNRRIFRILADRGTRVLLGHYDEEPVESARSSRSDSIRAEIFYRPQWFPYLAPELHNSAFGNDILARQFFALWRGAEGCGLDLIVTEEVIGNAYASPLPERRLDAFDRIAFQMGEDTVAEFARTDFAPGTRPAAVAAVSSAGLLGIKSAGRSLFDAAFVPVDDVSEGDEYFVEVGPQKRRYPLGRARVLRGDLALGWIETHAGFSLENATLEDSSGQKLRNGDEIFISDQRGVVILTGRVRGGVARLSASAGPFFVIRAVEDGYLEPDRVRAGGEITLTLESRGVSSAVPIGRWRVESKNYRFASRKLE